MPDEPRELRRGCHCGVLVAVGLGVDVSVGVGGERIGRSWRGVMVGVDDGVGVLLAWGWPSA